MKKIFTISLCMLLALMLALASAASSIVSPALNIIAKKNTMIKSGLVYNDIYFSERDFMKCLGVTEIDTVTVEELPSATCGVLKLGTLNVTEGQTIGRDYLSVLRFVPATEEVFSAELVFSCDGTEVPCVVKILDEVNYAPTFAEDSCSVSTYNNVSLYGSVRASDPEGDVTDLQIVSYPKHGTLTVTNTSYGSYKYTPTSGYVGDDEFVVVARDEYGNYSSVQTVNVNVEKNGVFFIDTAGHWCENAAICLYEMGAVEVVNYQDGMVFCPDDSVTREEFVAMVMKAMDVTTLIDSNSSFADNSSIDVKYRPYVATAQRMGYIIGKEADGVMYFDPKGNITKAEAAVVINNILGLEEGEYVTTFADDGAIPTWAKSAVYALTSAGVFNGDGEGVIAPSAVLSRAQTVQMLYNVIEDK
ncbi:MAG: S-layer homology domain-containing protein [Clostridia bacterium]|nr:S-layer homology domain-containing protein [Clostridia bacterium]